MHAELVCRGWQPREGSFVMDAPPHDDVEELKRLAGCPLRGDIADVGVKRAAQREQMMLEWVGSTPPTTGTENRMTRSRHGELLQADGSYGGHRKGPRSPPGRRGCAGGTESC